MSNPYSLNVTTNTYRVPSVTATTTKTSSSITVSATGTKGDGNIAKYMYSKDGGSNWTTQTSTSTTNSYTFSGLTSNTAYSIRVKVVDDSNRESSVYSVSVTTSYINPTVRITSTSKTSNSITVYYSGTAGSKSVSYYKVSCNSGSTYNNSYTTSYTCSGLIGSMTYGIRVIAVDTGGVQSSAATTSVTTDAATLVAKVKSLYTSQGSNGIYYHTSSLANSAGDNSYRYAGANPNNYVIFDIIPHVKFRIIGVFEDQVKLIQTPYYGQESWNGEDTGNNRMSIWQNSKLVETLNTTFLNGLLGNVSSKIVMSTWHVGGITLDIGLNSNAKTIYDYEVGNNKITGNYMYGCWNDYGDYFSNCGSASSIHSAKVGLMYLSDYMYAANPMYWTYSGSNYNAAKENNWLATVGSQTITRVLDNKEEVFHFERGYEGSILKSASFDVGSIYSPVFYLNSSIMLLSGAGTESNPYRIS